jgi:hypothetical protein
MPPRKPAASRSSVGDKSRSKPLLAELQPPGAATGTVSSAPSVIDSSNPRKTLPSDKAVARPQPDLSTIVAGLRSVLMREMNGRRGDILVLLDRVDDDLQSLHKPFTSRFRPDVPIEQVIQNFRAPVMENNFEAWWRYPGMGKPLRDCIEALAPDKTTARRILEELASSFASYLHSP